MHRFAPSLLDRLIDEEPKTRSEPVRPALSLEQLKDSVARDLESLLNARHGSSRGSLDTFSHASRSIAGFGLDDFAALSISSSSDRSRICNSIALAITNFEPRLREVVVEIDRRSLAGQNLRFAIQAVLVAHPLKEPVNFDAVLQTTTQNYAVLAGRRSS